MKANMYLHSLHIVVLLLVSYTHNIASAPTALPPKFDATRQACMTSLSYHVLSTLCPMYTEPDIPPEKLTLTQLEYTENILEECCIRSCSLTQLLSACNVKK